VLALLPFLVSLDECDERSFSVWAEVRTTVFGINRDDRGMYPYEFPFLPKPNDHRMLRIIERGTLQPVIGAS